jgi:hypothetical protein
MRILIQNSILSFSRKVFWIREESYMRMASIAHGTLALLFAAFLVLGLTLVCGCMRGIPATGGEPISSPYIVTTAPPVQPSASPTHPVTTASPVQLNLPPETANPTPRPAVDPIVGKWYAPVPDDLTFEFFPDGTFVETSPNFPAYHGTWSSSEEFFYDAYILDRWGYRKPANLLYASGILLTKGIGPMHRVE